MRVIAELEREIEIHPNQNYKPEEAIPCMNQWPLQAADRAVEGTVGEEPVDALCPQIEQLRVDNGFWYANSANWASRSSARRLRASTQRYLDISAICTFAGCRWKLNRRPGRCSPTRHPPTGIES